MHADLKDALDFHHAVLAEGARALVGYDMAKTVANVVLLSEIPTTYDKRSERQVNAGNLLLRGVPGVGKTFFGVILAAISDARFARIQGRADLQPTEAIVKQFLSSRSTAAPRASRHAPVTAAPKPMFELLTHRPRTPSADEIESNPRARSAKLRAGLKLAA